MPPRFPKNAPGDFYIVDGCCVTCGVMHDVAPRLIEWHKEALSEGGDVSWHCYVAQQPETPVEVAQMIEAMEMMDAECLRYGGEDPEMLTKLVEHGLRDQCDEPGLGDGFSRNDN